MNARIVVPPEVQAEIAAIDAWWRENRPAAPELFLEELAASCELLAGAPRIGREYSHPSVTDVRRVLLRSTRYHVYYKIHEEDVVLLAVWSGLRGHGPDLTTLV
jgi:plasmid stabilization system protein ParE